ncbi:hypothetical protein [Paracoccus yeei]|uniref:hypothetical protein n=1 Tax=Paracoccus yeei TaxID=147645 RepID=UPI001749AF99|nr:hypothetical protein [Paracoccus yeei]
MTLDELQQDMDRLGITSIHVDGSPGRWSIGMFARDKPSGHYHQARGSTLQEAVENCVHNDTSKLTVTTESGDGGSEGNLSKILC